MHSCNSNGSSKARLRGPVEKLATAHNKPARKGPCLSWQAFPKKIKDFDIAKDLGTDKERHPNDMEKADGDGMELYD